MSNLRRAQILTHLQVILGTLSAFTSLRLYFSTLSENWFSAQEFNGYLLL